MFPLACPNGLQVPRSDWFMRIKLPSLQVTALYNSALQLQPSGDSLLQLRERCNGLQPIYMGPDAAAAVLTWGGPQRTTSSKLRKHEDSIAMLRAFGVPSSKTDEDIADALDAADGDLDTAFAFLAM